MEATFCAEEEFSAEAEGDVRPRDTGHRYLKKTRPKHQKRFETNSGSSDSDSDSSLSSSFASCHARNGSRRNESTGSKVTYASHRAIICHEKDRQNVGLKELKATNPIYRQLLPYRYFRLDDSLLDRTPRRTGRVKDYI
eukprot:gb/GEZJ01003057.1/.p2 GENE.gb/GEZJ01003057.1/~~gb/GEZJ01003057.1/.p2  ORF type:complete len:139 (-),score=16.02 gb/GEZJ01003057.1/:4020-4436(-)